MKKKYVTCIQKIVWANIDAAIRFTWLKPVHIMETNSTITIKTILNSRDTQLFTKCSPPIQAYILRNTVYKSWYFLQMD